MLAEDLPGEIHDGAGPHRLGRAPRHQARVVVVGHEADLLRIRLAEDRKPQLLGKRAHRGLAHAADRQQHPRQPLARRAEEHVALVLVQVHAPPQREAAGIVRLHARVVAACHELRVDLLGVVVQLAELQPVVAAHARVRRAAGVVFAHEVIDDPPEVLLEVHHVEGNAELRRHQPRVGGVVDGTAALVADLERDARAARPRHRALVRTLELVERLAGAPEAHEHSHHVMPRALQERGGDGGIDSARHGEEDAGHSGKLPGVAAGALRRAELRPIRPGKPCNPFVQADHRHLRARARSSTGKTRRAAPFDAALRCLEITVVARITRADGDPPVQPLRAARSRRAQGQA